MRRNKWKIYRQNSLSVDRNNTVF